MLRTGRLPAPHGGGLPPPRPRGLARRRECCYRGPWRLPGPDSHRLAAVSLALGYVVAPSFRWSSAPELLDAHSRGTTRRCVLRRHRPTERAPHLANCHSAALVSGTRAGGIEE